jgi:hypothetical protein
MILMPGLAHDHAVIAALMQEWDVGIAMPGDAPFGTAGNVAAVSREDAISALRAAAEKILATQSYRRNAQARAEMLAGIDGAGNASAEIEALVS